MADARTEGTFFQDAELVGAAGLDAFFDAPTWAWNKLTGDDATAPTHLAADVYLDQTQGEWTDVTGQQLDPDAVAAAVNSSEDQGAVVDAAAATANQVAQNPISVIPAWAWVLGAIAAAGVAAFGVAYVVRAFK